MRNRVCDPPEYPDKIIPAMDLYTMKEKKRGSHIATNPPEWPDAQIAQTSGSQDKFSQELLELSPYRT